MKRLYALVLTLFIIVAFSCVPAMAESAFSDCTHVGDEVSALEDGHYNIAFSNGYNGFCICYGLEEATEGDGFTIVNIGQAINNNTGEDVSQYLKHLFVDHFEQYFSYSAADGVKMDDKIALQFAIWAFTDDFSNWRVDPKLIDDVKSIVKSGLQPIPDHGYIRKLDDTTMAIFDFHTLQTKKGDNYQNFWTYKITVAPYPAPVITKPTQDQAIKVPVDQTTTLSVTATYAEKYQWQVDAGDGFKDIEGATTASYTTPAATEEMKDHKYQCVVSNTAGSSTSPVFSLIVVEKPVFTTPTADQEVSVYETKTVQLTAEATGADSYQWQVDTGEGFADIEGATQTTYTTPAINDQNSGYKYRCVASNIAGSTESKLFSLKMIPAPQIVDPAADKLTDVYDGKSAQLSVTATDAESYQWQVDTGEGFADIEGATQSSYTTPAVTQDNSSYKYRCIASNPAGSDVSPSFSLNRIPAPKIIEPAQDTAVTVDERASKTLTVVAEYAESYQWQVDTGDGFEDIANATSATYTIPSAQEAYSGYKYRCIATNPAGSTYSPVFTLDVIDKDPPVVTGTDKTITVKTGQQTTLTVSAENGKTYQWQVKTEDGYEDIEGATSDAYTVPASETEATSQYRCVVSNDNGETAGPVNTVIVKKPSATPETGDLVHPVLLVCVMLVSLAAFAVIWKFARMKKA